MDNSKLLLTLINLLAWGVWLFMAWFLVWKRTRMDYHENDVFELLVWLTTIAAILGFLATKLSMGLMMPFWMMILGVWVFSKKKGWDFWEWVDGLGSLSLNLGMWGALISQRWKVVGGMVVGLVLARYLERKYKTIWWYKSGKVGLVGLFSLGWWALIEFAVVNIQGFRIYWVGFKPETVLSIITLLITLGVVFVRSENLWQKLIQKKL